MRKSYLLVPILLVMLTAPLAAAIEKKTARATDLDWGDWASQTTCVVSYYNFCTGWYWMWNGWSPHDVIGVCFDASDCAYGQDYVHLTATSEYLRYGAPAGYGLTGTIDVWTTEADCCLGSRLAGQPFYFYTGWNTHDWGGMQTPVAFVVTVTFSDSHPYHNPSWFVSDRPAAGPTGPQACGYCYPMPRTCHSFWYGTTTTILCPGFVLSDGICCVEWMWNAAVYSGVGVKESSWGAVKVLYR
jgi:hypothetical protein